VSGVAGVEIGRDRVRVVVRTRRGTLHTYEMPIAADRLDDVVAQLSAAAGDVRMIGLAIGLAHLHVKQVKLPPVKHAARRQMLAVEPERWFVVPQGSPTAVSLTPGGDIALGADGAYVEACVRAFSKWAPVQRVEAAPLALTRALNSAGQRAAVAALDAPHGEVGVVETRDGALFSVRRARATDLAAPAVSPTTSPGLDPAFSAAFGAALAFDGALDFMLLTPALEGSFVGAQRRRVAMWSVAAAVAVTAVLWSAGASRERLRGALDTEVAAARAQARAGSSLALRAMSIDRELAAISTTTRSRPDALTAMSALGLRLPVSAVAQRVRMVGNEWQVEGNAKKAAAVLAALAAEPHFEKVRFLAPSNRFRDGTDDRETFAIAFAIR
jgi:hypothetical protein